MNAFAWGQGWHIVGWTMIYFLGAGTLVLLAGAVLRFALRGASPTLRYTTSLAVFAIIALLPLGIAGSLASRVVPQSPSPQYSGETSRFEYRGERSSEVVNEYTTSALTDPAEKQALLPEGKASSSVKLNHVQPVQQSQAIASLLTGAVEYLPWVWIVGTPLTFLLLASGLVGAERLRKTSRSLDAGPIIETCETLRKALAVGRRVSVAVCDRVATPLLVGIVRPLILLPPAALTGWSQAELEMVLLHELAHVRRWDNLVNLAQRVVESLLFFHPAVWIASRWVRRDREDCCDAVVVAYTAKPQAYAELLLALASPHPQGGLTASAAMALSQHPLASRIRRILNLEDEPMLVSRKTLIAIATGVLSLVLTVALVAPHSTDAEEPGARESEKASRVVSDPGTSESETKASRERQRPEEEEVATEKEAGQQFSKYSRCIRTFSIPLPEKGFANPGELEIWQQTNLTLVKSAFILTKAIEEGELSSLPLIQNSKPNQIGWLYQNLQVRLTPENVMTLELRAGTEKDYQQACKIVSAIESAFLKELENSSKLSREANPLFPTLEEQRAADVAYKLLHIELEKLSEEDLKRVKALGYRGGLKVTSQAMGEGFPGMRPLQNDLLVGLHVWPTESLDQVNKILTRDDLDQLSPLKFYVIRHEVEGMGGYGGAGGYGGGEAQGKDHVITGRIHVDHDAWRELPPIKNEIAIQRMLQEKEEERLKASIGKNPSPELRYDGKTFEEWKNAWRHDLSPEVRTRAVNAFVAFANAGKGKEAVDEILAIVAQYDWKPIRNPDKNLGSLQNACKSSFSFPRLPDDAAIEGVIEAASSKNQRLNDFAGIVAYSLAKSKASSYIKLQERLPKGYLPFDKTSAKTQESDLPDNLQLSIAPYNKKPLAGSRATYQFFVENHGVSADEQVQLSVKFPADIVPDLATLQSVVQGKSVGNEIRFAPIASLRKGERLSFTITTSVLKAGIVNIEATAKSKNVPEGVKVTERVEIVGF